MSKRPFIIVSGLPASGKSTLARQLAAAFALPMLDKDDFLEQLFEELGVGDLAWRQHLSRKSDAQLSAAASESAGAVVTSFWRHPRLDGNSGTPTDWIVRLSPKVVEVYCDCPAALAVDRFQARDRHPGHIDAGRAPVALLHQFEALSAYGPLGIAPLVRVETMGDYEVDKIVAAVGAAMPS